MDFSDKLFLAPLAGITDSAYRQICKIHGADIVVSEMVSAEGIKYRSANTLSLLSFRECERPVGIQLFGSDPYSLSEAAKFVQDYANPDFIDLNAGCPVPKVVKKNGGSSLLRDRHLFEQILTAMVKAVDIPVTVKIRSGWKKHEWVDVQFAKTAQECGVSCITLHPRSQTMGFSGSAFWERITEVKQAVSIPVVGNGDICNESDALKMLNLSGCDSLMIGRATYGNPWIFAAAKAALSDKPYTPPSARERIATIVRHLELFACMHGEQRACKEMKKHVAWYIKGMPGAAVLRNRLFRSETIDELRDIIDLLKDGMENG
ncbi:tRNA dihydrouridine synthase B [Chitinispirillum alkaliphilum]|nr:tRNA dihydrouridine synthase B [Chitinispirillum alkaliphilum]